MKLFAVAAAVLLAGAQEKPAIQELEKRITIDARGTFDDFIRALRPLLGLDLIVDSRSREKVDFDARHELILRDVKGSSALRWATALYGLDYAVQGRTVVIGLPHWVSAPVLRVYDARPLLARTQDRVGPAVYLADPSHGFSVVTNEPKESAVPAERLVDLIKETVAPGTWEGELTVEMSPDQRLLVSQYPRAQGEVARFLEALGALTAPVVTVSAEAVEVEDPGALLGPPGAAAVFGPESIEGVAERVRAGRKDGNPRVLHVSGSAAQRFHTLLLEEGSAVADWEGNDPITWSGLVQVGSLDCRPLVVAGGKYIWLELRWAEARTTDLLPPFRMGKRELTFQERGLVRLGTTFLVPNGGGVLLGFPVRSHAAARRPVCLVRASSDKAPPAGPIVIDCAEPSDKALLEKLRKLPPVSIDFENVTLEDLIKWFREKSGLNVVLDAPDVKGEKFSVQGKDTPLHSLLTLVLEPRGLVLLARDEALHIAPASRKRQELQIALLDVRDMTYGLQDFPRPGEEGANQQFTGEDLAVLIQNTVRKDRWEEADGKSIGFENGILIIRNEPEIVEACVAFVEEMRRGKTQIVTVRAEAVVVDGAPADAVLGRAGADGYLIDEKQYKDLLRAGTVVEQLYWHSFDNQRTTMSWDRKTGYLRDFDIPEDPKLPEDPIPDAYLNSSFLQVRPTIARDGRTVEVEVVYDGRRLEAVDSKPVTETLSIQVPRSSATSVRTTLRVPEDKIAVLKWSAPSKGGEGRYRLLVLKPGVWRP